MKPHTRRILIIIALLGLFVLPMITAWFFVQRDIKPSHHTTNHGQLVASSPKLLLFRLQTLLPKTSHPIARWALVWQLPAGHCGQPCHAQIEQLLRVQRALGKDRGRVVVLGLLSEQRLNHTRPPPRSFPLLTYTKPRIDKWQRFIDYLKQEKITVSQQSVFLFDPSGVIVEVYTPLQARLLLKDLKHLLKIASRRAS